MSTSKAAEAAESCIAETTVATEPAGASARRPYAAPKAVRICVSTTRGKSVSGEEGNTPLGDPKGNAAS